MLGICERLKRAFDVIFAEDRPSGSIDLGGTAYGRIPRRRQYQCFPRLLSNVAGDFRGVAVCELSEYKIATSRTGITRVLRQRKPADRGSAERSLKFAGSAQSGRKVEPLGG